MNGKYIEINEPLILTFIGMESWNIKQTITGLKKVMSNLYKNSFFNNVTDWVQEN